MKKRYLGLATRPFSGLLSASALLGCTLGAFTHCALAQDQRGDWPLAGADAGQSGWQKDELGLTPESVAANFKFLWKMQLGQPSKGTRSFSEPLLAGRLINAQGFKDIVYWSSADTLYAVDSELGALIWKKQFKAGAPMAAGCGNSSLNVLMEPPVVINFNARRRRAPGTPRPPDAPPAATSERRLGAAPGGGYFGLKGIYVLTPDGMLHEQVMTTGADFAPPVKFLPAAGGSPFGLSFADKMIFTVTGRDCGGVANGLWAVDLASGEYGVTSSSTEKVRPVSLTGPVITPDGATLFVTAKEASDATPNHPGSVVAIDKEMKVKDWYTPDGAMASSTGVSPVTFTYKGKQLVVAPGKDGSIALLDAASLGGADHHTPLFETSAISKPGEKHGWDSFATWQEKDGTTWVLASISTGITLNAGKSDGTSTHGGVAAFKIGDTDGKLSLIPAWVSEDMVNPAPPRIANGVVVALAGGDTKTHATLFVLNAATGAQIFSSKDQIPTYSELSGVAVGDSHALFTDHNNVLYSFGLPLEH